MEERRHRRPTALTLTLVLCLGASGGCTWLQALTDKPADLVSRTIRPEPAYDRLFPRYVELCAVTQYREKHGALGGIPGHAVMYLRGYCRDQDAPYPRLSPCQIETADPWDARHGVGISVNKIFRNVNWVGIPGKRLFLDGELPPAESLTQERFDAVLQESIGRGLFRGIEVHDEYLDQKPPEMGLEEFIAREAIGTDFALRFARTIYCANMPVTSEQMVAIASYLNTMNERYQQGDPYQWHGYHDNCVHLLVNSLAAADVWEGISARESKLRQLSNLAIPANEMIRLGDLANYGPLEDRAAVAADPNLREALESWDWLPTRHGGLVSSLPIHQDNQLFDIKQRILLVDSPFGRNVSQRAERLLLDARNTELEANLRSFRRRYASILEAAGPESVGERDGFDAEYLAYIRRQHNEVERMLGDLGPLRDGPH